MIPFSEGLPAAEPWMQSASCAEADPEAFFPENDRTGTFDAKRVCAKCPVIDPCLQYALDHGERYGIWGGHSERERFRLRRGEHVTPRMPRQHQPKPEDYSDCVECGTPFIKERGHITCSSMCRKVRAARIKSLSDQRKRDSLKERTA